MLLAILYCVLSVSCSASDDADFSDLRLNRPSKTDPKLISNICSYLCKFNEFHKLYLKKNESRLINVFFSFLFVYSFFLSFPVFFSFTLSFLFCDLETEKFNLNRETFSLSFFK